MQNQLSDGRSFRLSSVLDDFNRKIFGIETELSLPAARVIRTLDNIIEWRGKPAAIPCKHGPAYISDALLSWAESRAPEHGPRRHHAHATTRTGCLAPLLTNAKNGE